MPTLREGMAVRRALPVASVVSWVGPACLDCGTSSRPKRGRRRRRAVWFELGAGSARQSVEVCG